MKISLLLFTFFTASAGLYAQSSVSKEVATDDSLGIAGQISLTGGLGWYPRSGSSLSVNHRQKRASFYLTYSMANDKAPQWITNDCAKPVVNSFVHTHATMGRTVTQTNHTLQTGADFSLGQKTTVGLLLSGFSFQTKIDAHLRMTTEQGTDHQTGTHVAMQINEQRQWQHALINAHIQHQFAPKHTLSVDVDQLCYVDMNPNYFTSQPTDEAQAETGPDRTAVIRRTPVQISVAKVDYSRPVGSQSTLEIGLKGSQIGLQNRIDRIHQETTGWQPDATGNQNDQLVESIGAAYTRLNARLSDRTHLIVGLQTEYANTQMRDAGGESLVNRRFWCVLPLVSFTRNSGDNRQYVVTYNRRLTRTPFDMLASFNLFWDARFQTGNPAVLPALADIVRASYSVNDFALTLQYTHERNPMSRFAPFFNSINNTISFRAGNIDRSTTVNITAALPVTICSGWQTRNSAMVLYGKAVATLQNQAYQIAQIGAQFNTTHTFQLPRAFTAEVTAWYASATINEFGRLLNRGDVTVSVQKKLSGNRGTLTASISDLFWTNRIRSVTSVPELGLDNRTSFALNEPRIVRVVYTRSFGNLAVKAVGQRGTASDEDRKRVN